jgi:hypothetical protein
MKMRSVWLASLMVAILVTWAAAFGAAGSPGRSKGQKGAKQQAQSRMWGFDRVAPGKLPGGWKVAETNGKGKPGTWQVVRDPNAPSAPNVLALTKTENTRNTYNLLLAGRTRYQDLELEVKVKAVSGKEDQGGGPLWRAADPNNYYLTRWNPLENNLRLYYVQAAKRTQIANADITTDPKAWHTLKVTHIGNKITVAFDGKTLIEKEDATFSAPGRIGLWTKADAATAFDDLKVEPRGSSEDGKNADRIP